MRLNTLPAGMVQERAGVLFNRRVAPDHFHMRLVSPPAARRARPGQFVHLLCPPQADSLSGKSPLLRRPLSLFDVNPRAGTVEIIYKVVGTGTATLARVQAGGRVDLLGPLGSSFEIPQGIRRAWLVGGGVGIPPLYFLAKDLLERQETRDKRQVRAFLGARTKDWVICASDFRRLGVQVHVATDDGTLGYKGSVVDLVGDVITRDCEAKPKQDRSNLAFYICGPTGMMAAAAALARRRGIPAQVSLEERMGCAMGCCMGCVVEVTTEPANSHARFQRVCTEGPVFQAQDVLWRTS